jgi:hypothetical protein
MFDTLLKLKKKREAYRTLLHNPHFQCANKEKARGPKKKGGGPERPAPNVFAKFCLRTSIAAEFVLSGSCGVCYLLLR